MFGLSTENWKGTKLIKSILVLLILYYCLLTFFGSYMMYDILLDEKWVIQPFYAHFNFDRKKISVKIEKWHISDTSPHVVFHSECWLVFFCFVCLVFFNRIVLLKVTFTTLRGVDGTIIYVHFFFVFLWIWLTFVWLFLLLLLEQIFLCQIVPIINNKYVDQL